MKHFIAFFTSMTVFLVFIDGQNLRYWMKDSTLSKLPDKNGHIRIMDSLASQF